MQKLMVTRVCPLTRRSVMVSWDLTCVVAVCRPPFAHASLHTDSRRGLPVPGVPARPVSRGVKLA